MAGVTDENFRNCAGPAVAAATDTINVTKKILFMGSSRAGNFEIGQILHLRSEISKFLIGPRSRPSNLRFRISGLRCRIRPISKSYPRDYNAAVQVKCPLNCEVNYENYI